MSEPHIIVKPWSARYVALFILIQLVSLVLTVIGYPLIAVLALFKWWHLQEGVTHFGGVKGDVWAGGKLTWVYSNDEDGIFGNGPVTRWQAFYWSALRNPCNNLRYVHGVSGAGRPLWHWDNGTFYVQAGWLGSHGQPVLSAGRGTGY
jgi:hypothetical protein